MAAHELESTASSSSSSRPGERDVVAEFSSFQELVSECASKLSSEGILVARPVVQELGSRVTFEVRIRDSFSVLRGEGEVLQIDEDGAALRFVYLDQPSRRLLPRLVEHYRRAGSEPFELPTAASPVAEELPVEVGLEPEILPALAEESSLPGLTLDDLEAEFLSPRVPASALPEMERDTETGSDDVDEEELALAQPVLVDAEELAAGLPRSDEFTPTDIHVDDLLGEGDQEQELAARGEPEEPGSSADVAEESAQIDPGLPWLIDEKAKSRKGDLWIVLLLILLGALLGAAVYYYLVRGRSSSSESQPVQAGDPSIQLNVTDSIDPPEPIAQPPTTRAPAVSVASPAAPPPKPTANVALAADAPENASRPEGEVPPAEELPLTGIDRITWNERGGETIVILWADGSFTDAQIERVRVVGGAPRELVKIRGIRRPCPEQRVELQTDHVRRIRTGLHDSSGGPSLHVVADLADGAVEVRRTEAEGSQLRLYFSKTG